MLHKLDFFIDVNLEFKDKLRLNQTLKVAGKGYFWLLIND